MHTTIDLKTLSAGQRSRLARELYDLHSEIFDGVDLEVFDRYAFQSPARETALRIYRDADERPVGYFVAHVYEHTFRGRTVAICRGEVGFRSDARGHNQIATFALGVALRYKLRHPTTPMYYLGALVHPSSYAQLTRFADRVWPSPKTPTPPPEEAELLAALDEHFGLRPVDPQRPLVREVGWTTRVTAAEDRHWRAHQNPAVRFFLQHNPGYGRGEGLLTLSPLTLTGMLRSAGRFIGSKLSRWLDPAPRRIAST
jgi:hypothetical protein